MADETQAINSLDQLLPTAVAGSEKSSTNGSPSWLAQVQGREFGSAAEYALSVCLAASRDDLGRGERAALGVVANTADLAVNSGNGYYGITKGGLAAVLAIKESTAEQTLANLVRTGILVWNPNKAASGDRLARIPDKVWTDSA